MFLSSVSIFSVLFLLIVSERVSCYTEGVAKLSIPAAAQLFNYVLAKGNSIAILFVCHDFVHT